MKKLTKALAMILAVLMLTSVMTACGGGGSGKSGGSGSPPPKAGGTAAKKTEAEKRAEISDDLADKDFGGADFNILIRSNDPDEIGVTSATGAVVGDAAFARSSSVASRFNVKFNFVKKAAGSDYSDAVAASAAADDGAYSLILGAQSDLASSAMNGSLADVKSVSGINLDKPWWTKYANNSLTIGNKLYLASGDLSTSMWKNMYVTYFNKDIISAYSLKSPIDLVNGDAWTFDRYIELAIASSGSYRTFIGNANNFAQQFVVSIDMPITEMKDGYPALVLNSAKAQKSIARLAELFTSKKVQIVDSLAVPGVKSFPEEFTGGTTLFMTGYLGDAVKLREQPVNFGIIPMPKYDEYQETVFTTAYKDMSHIAFVKGLKNAEMSGIITEALSAESYKSVSLAFYESVLNSAAARDNESEDMLDIMHDGFNMNFGLVYSASIGNIADLIKSVAAGETANFEEAYKANEAAYKDALSSVSSAFKGIA